LQNKDKMLISKTIGKNGSFKDVMLCFSSQRAECETDVTSEPKAKQSFTNRLLRFATANLVMTLVFDPQHYLLCTILLEVGK